ncbi:hypothetical protein L1049_005128 [Liquidambar formosana]|uniref:Myb/SANT-like domain-containing protein n=1 Tax=Liquidambar formosana TaxID=63359 RepID=A0AAP0RUJ3_LIQFO
MELTIKGGMRFDNGTFKPGYLTMIENALAITCPNSRLKAHPHIEYSKIKTMKKPNTLVVDMLGNSGFGWNETLKCVDCLENNVWETYLKCTE